MVNGAKAVGEWHKLLKNANESCKALCINRFTCGTDFVLGFSTPFTNMRWGLEKLSKVSLEMIMAAGIPGTNVLTRYLWTQESFCCADEMLFIRGKWRGLVSSNLKPIDEASPSSFTASFRDNGCAFCFRKGLEARAERSCCRCGPDDEENQCRDP